MPIGVLLEKLHTRNSILLAGVGLVALAIRFWNFGSLGYQHWDEFYFLSDAQTVGKQWPGGFQSIGWVETPLVAYTDGTLFHFLGNIIWIPLAVSAVYGTLSCIALYFLGSALFSPGVGLIGTAIVATSEFAAMFSRMAIADATFDFWLIAAALFIWLGFERRRLMYYVLAGVSAGIVLNAKYDGIFPLVFAASWLLAEFVVDAFKRTRSLRALAREYNARLFGTWVMVGIAIVLFMPFFEKVAIYPGWPAVLAHAQSFGPNSLIRTPPQFIVSYFLLFGSGPTVIVATAGIAVGLIRFSRADRFLLIYTAGWFVAVMLFAPYPREALSLLPAVAIWAGRAILEFWRLARGLRPPMRVMGPAAAALAFALVLIAQAIPLSHMLSLRTQGYADAGAVAASYQASGNTIFTRTQAVALLYLKDTYFLDPDPAVVQLLNAKGSNVVFMTDQALSWYPSAQHLFDLNRNRLQVIDRVPNPLYDEVLLQPATEDGLAHINDPPDSYRYITFWRVMAPLAYPADWPS